MRKFPAAQAKYKGESRRSPPEHAAQGTDLKRDRRKRGSRTAQDRFVRVG